MRGFINLFLLLPLLKGLDGLGKDHAERKNIKAKYMETWLTATHIAGKGLDPKKAEDDYKGKRQTHIVGDNVSPNLPHRMVMPIRSVTSNLPSHVGYWRVGTQFTPADEFNSPTAAWYNGHNFGTHPHGAWGNPHFFCVDMPRRYFFRNPGDPSDKRWMARFMSAYSQFWLEEEPTSFRWNRRFDFKSGSTDVANDKGPMVERHERNANFGGGGQGKTQGLWKERFDNWNGEKLHFRVEVTGIKRLTKDVETYLKGWFHLRIRLFNKNDKQSGMIIDRLMVTARGLTWSVNSDGMEYYWPYNLAHIHNRRYSYQPHRVWEGGIGEFYYKNDRKGKKDLNCGSAVPEQNFVPRQFIPCGVTQTTQTQYGNNFIYVRPNSEADATKFGGTFSPGAKALDEIHLNFKLDQSFCNKFAAVDFVVNGVAIKNDVKDDNPLIKNEVDWRSTRGREISAAVEATSSTRIIFFPDLFVKSEPAPTDYTFNGMDKVFRPGRAKGGGDTDSFKDVDLSNLQNLESNMWMRDRGLYPHFYENADPPPEDDEELNCFAKLDVYDPSVPLRDQSASFYGAIKEILPFQDFAEPDEKQRGLTYSNWDLYDAAGDMHDQALDSNLVAFHETVVREWNWWRHRQDIGIPARPQTPYPQQFSAKQREDFFYDPNTLPYFDATFMPPFISYSKGTNTGLENSGNDFHIFPPQGQQITGETLKHKLSVVYTGFGSKDYWKFLEKGPPFAGRAGGGYTPDMFYGWDWAPTACDRYQSAHYVLGTNAQMSTFAIVEAPKRKEERDRRTIRNDDWDPDDANLQISLIHPDSTLAGSGASFAGMNMNIRPDILVPITGHPGAELYLSFATRDPILRNLRLYVKSELKKRKKGQKEGVWNNSVPLLSGYFDDFCNNAGDLSSDFKCPIMPPNPSTVDSPESLFTKTDPAYVDPNGIIGGNPPGHGLGSSHEPGDSRPGSTPTPKYPLNPWPENGQTLPPGAGGGGGGGGGGDDDDDNPSFVQREALDKDTLKYRRGMVFDNPASLYVWDSRLMHAASMVILTCLVVPINLFLTRYYKETFMDSRLFLHHVWYYVHLLGSYVIVLMFMYGLWRQHESRDILGVSLKHPAFLHRLVGWVAVGIATVLFLFGGCRCFPHCPRCVCIFLHWLLGFTFYLCLLCCLFTGIGIPGTPASFQDASLIPYNFANIKDEFLFWMFCIWIVFDLVLQIVMSILLCKTDRRMKLTGSRRYYPAPIPVLRENYRFDAPGRQCRIHLLRLYIIISCVVTLLCVYFLFSVSPRNKGMGPMSCTHYFDPSLLTGNQTDEIFGFETCEDWPMKCGGEKEVSGCDIPPVKKK